MKRLFLFLVLVASAIFFHPIIAVMLGLVFGITAKNSYYEIIILGILIDTLYHTLIIFPMFQIPIYTIITMVLFFCFSFVKKQLNIYA